MNSGTFFENVSASDHACITKRKGRGTLVNNRRGSKGKREGARGDTPMHYFVTLRKAGKQEGGREGIPPCIIL